MEQLDREKGRFRSYLLGALKHFLSRQRTRDTAQKRGSGAKHVSLSQIELPAGLPPDEWFDRQWAMALLAVALKTVENESRASGNEQLFSHLSPWLIGESEHGDQVELAKQTGLSVSGLKSSIHRMRKRFRQAVKAEISRTLENPNDVDA